MNGKPRGRPRDEDKMATGDAEAVIALQGHFGDSLACNELTRVATWRKNTEWVMDAPRPLKDGDASQACIWLHKMGIKAGIKTCATILKHTAQETWFNELRDWMQSLKWDGGHRLDNWLTTYALCEDDDATRAIGRKWLIGAVARVMSPGCKFDNVLVLGGPQGAGKSTLFAVIGGAYFRDDLANMNSKDASDSVTGCWIMELAELSSLRKNEVEDVKRFISRTHEIYRPSFAEFEVTRPRMCAFGGTTNKDKFLIDDTGNRRFWSVTTGAWIDITGLREVRDQLIAEAVHAYAGGEQWHITNPMLLAAIAMRNEELTVGDEVINDLAEIVNTRQSWKMSELWERLGNSGSQKESDQRRYGRALKLLGWQAKAIRENGKVLWRWVNVRGVMAGGNGALQQKEAFDEEN